MRIHFVANRSTRRPNPLAVAAGLFENSADGAAPSNFDTRYQSYLDDNTYQVAEDPADADFISNIDDFAFEGVADECRAVIAKSGKPGVFFDFSDGEAPTSPLDAILYRTSLSAKNRQPHERCIGGMAVDVVGAGVEFAPVPYGNRPRVAFCGLVTPMLRRIVMHVTGRKNQTSQWLRSRCLKALRSAHEVDTDFLVREKYLANTAFRDVRSAARQEFLQNLAGSPYALCVRGYGNYSVRFFETLAAGRIPVLIDTDGALPYPELIAYEQHCVIVPVAELDAIGQHIAAFHEAHDATSFEQLQRANRGLWDQYFAPPTLIHQAVDHALTASPCTR